MPGGGILKIATENVEISELSIAAHRGVPAGRYVMLTVTDSGTGMDAATQARLFEPFFTTKEAGKGTGLGLAVVRSIVAQSGGHVTVQSELGRGSTFKVFLPIVEQTEQAQPTKKTEDSPRGSETVLLVEDAQSVRIVIRDYLESGGYFVLEPETLGQVLELARKHQGPIHLLLTDVVMPGMGGAELARQIRSVRPDSKVLYMSGYAPRAAGRDEGLEEGASFLQKPFTSEDLLRSVRRVLDKSKS
jgi:two-component system cell cycle sensor histidine kinase/response regulator CckA